MEEVYGEQYKDVYGNEEYARMMEDGIGSIEHDSQGIPDGYEEVNGGHEVTMEDMIRHTQAVRRGSPNAFLVGDMPYMSYQPSPETAVRNAGRFMAEATCDGIKLEGGAEMAWPISVGLACARRLLRGLYAKEFLLLSYQTRQ